MRRAPFMLLVLLAACRQGVETPSPQAPLGSVLALWSGGEVDLPEIEARIPTTHTAACRAAREGGGSVDLLIPCYREIAEEIVLEAQVRDKLGEPDPSSIDNGVAELRRQIYLRTFRNTVGAAIEVSDEKVSALYEERRDELRRPPSLSLWNIFRRHREPESPEKTSAFLREIKTRVENGETFQSLAREFSDSETRLRDGFVGRIEAGELPAPLEEIAFELESGEVSEPVPVRGGAVLLYVRDPDPGIRFGLEDVRSALERELEAEEIHYAIEERISDSGPPDGSVVLQPAELEERVAADEQNRVVFRVGDREITAAELRMSAGLPAGPLSEAQVDHLNQLYEGVVESELLYLDLASASDPLAVAVREEAEEILRSATTRLLLNEALERDVAGLVDADPAALEQYFRDNAHHYQSMLRFRLRLWSQPFGSDPPAQLAAMERAQASLAAGERTLEELAAELGGTIEDLGWRDFDTLFELPEKARQIILQTESAGYSVPYQQDDAIHLIEVAERSEPRALTYDEVAGRVRDDYTARFAQRLTRQAVDARLAESGFRFFDDRLRQLLESP